MTFKSASVLVVGDLSVPATSLVASLKEALGSQAPDFSLTTLNELSEVPAYISKNSFPKIFFLSLPKPSERERLAASDTLGSLRKDDPGICILICSDVFPSTAETMAWLDAGASGIVRRKFQGLELAEPLREALQKRLGIA